MHSLLKWKNSASAVFNLYIIIPYKIKSTIFECFSSLRRLVQDQSIREKKSKTTLRRANNAPKFLICK